MDNNNKSRALKGWIASLKDNPQRRLRLIMTVGLLGILLIFLSECGISDKKENKQVNTSNTSASFSAFELENRLKTMIEKIDGAGRTDVMITFENSGEKVYVSEEKTREETMGTMDEKNSQKTEREESYIMVDSENGGKTALISEERVPEIQGVIVVCDGGDDPVVSEKLTQTVKTALNIGSNRICVLKRVS